MKKGRGMHEKSGLDCYLKFYESAWVNFNERRNFQWKFNLALWGAIALTIALALQGKFEAGERLEM
ncbi:MAG: hypothetical protein ACYSX0_11080 [Planctomycetota bacterium]|jgi:hypothetical protein